MIKKITLASVVALSLLAGSAQAGPMQCKNAKCSTKKMSKRKASPFLIKHGLPHYTKMLMKSWDDPKLGLTQEQKTKLLQVRKTTLSSVKKLKPQIITLKQEIVQAARSGAKASTLQSKVEKLAALEAEATMTHLQCIEKTEATLKPEQLNYLKMQKRTKKNRPNIKQM